MNAAIPTTVPGAAREAPRSLRCLAIVPAFNERAAIAGVVAELRALGEIDVLVVDDGSNDGTAAAAVGAGARVVTLPFNLGIGGAVQTGYVAALEGGYDIAAQVDGDGQHPPSQLAKLIEAVARDEADIVIGSRFLEAGSYRAPFARRAGIGVFARVLSLLLRTRVTDTTSGFRVAGPRGILLFAGAYPHDYPEVEAIVIAKRAGLRIIELPVEMRERQTGRTSITPLRSAYYMVKVLMAVLMQMLRRPERIGAEP